MATLKALGVPCLHELANPRTGQCLELAVQLFGRVVECSPSLASMGNILKERVLSHTFRPDAELNT